MNNIVQRLEQVSQLRSGMEVPTVHSVSLSPPLETLVSVIIWLLFPQFWREIHVTYRFQKATLPQRKAGRMWWVLCNAASSDMYTVHDSCVTCSHQSLHTCSSWWCHSLPRDWSSTRRRKTWGLETNWTLWNSGKILFMAEHWQWQTTVYDRRVQGEVKLAVL